MICSSPPSPITSVFFVKLILMLLLKILFWKGIILNSLIPLPIKIDSFSHFFFFFSFKLEPISSATSFEKLKTLVDHQVQPERRSEMSCLQRAYISVLELSFSGWSKPTDCKQMTCSSAWCKDIDTWGPWEKGHIVNRK